MTERFPLLRARGGIQTTLWFFMVDLFETGIKLSQRGMKLARRNGDRARALVYYRRLKIVRGKLSAFYRMLARHEAHLRARIAFGMPLVSRRVER